MTRVTPGCRSADILLLFQPLSRFGESMIYTQY